MALRTPTYRAAPRPRSHHCALFTRQQHFRRSLSLVVRQHVHCFAAEEASGSSNRQGRDEGAEPTAARDAPKVLASGNSGGLTGSWQRFCVWIISTRLGAAFAGAARWLAGHVVALGRLKAGGVAARSIKQLLVVDLITFAAAGLAAVWLVLWLVCASTLKTHRPYAIKTSYAEARGVMVGTPVTAKGVQVGRVAAATALPDRVDVVLQVNDDSVVVPMRSTAVLHQYGLMAPATHIELRPPADLLPQTVEAAKTSNPHSAACTAQGAIVCHNGRLAGQQGGSVDEVTRITVKRMRAKSRDA